MIRKIACISMLLWAGLQLASAQNVLKGRVVDHDGNPIAGAKVENVKGNEQTTTDMNGQFSLETDQPVSKVNVYYMGLQTAHKKAKPDMLVKMGGISWWSAKPEKYQWFVGPQVAIPSSNHINPAFGLTFGRVKNWGWYVKGLYSKMPSGEEDSRTRETWCTGEVKNGYLSATAGGIRRLFGQFYLYAGAGYVNQKVRWEHTNGLNDRYEVYGESHSGIACELGLSLRIKHFFINGGASTTIDIDSDYDGEPKAVANFGIGYIF